MQLTEQQKDTVRQWAREGCGLSEIQKRLSSELGLSMTYMDVRFLALDLGLELQEKAAPRPPAKPADVKPGRAKGLAADAPLAGADAGLDDAADAPRLNVQVDRVTKPGSLASGSVVFSDGVTASWSVDQFGRLALAASKPGYRPSQDDLMAFQGELQEALARRGF